MDCFVGSAPVHYKQPVIITHAWYMCTGVWGASVHVQERELGALLSWSAAERKGASRPLTSAPLPAHKPL